MNEHLLGWVVAIIMTFFCAAHWAYARWLEGALKRGWEREAGYCGMIDQYRAMLSEDRSKS